MTSRARVHTTPTLDSQMDVAVGRRAPFTQVGDWVALSSVSVQAKAIYWMLSAHTKRRHGDGDAWPSRESLAEWCGFRQARSVDRYIAELVELGAIDVHTRRFDNGMRARNLYVIHEYPPDGYTGLMSFDAYHQAGQRTANTPHSRSAPQRTTVPPAQTREPAGQQVVRPSAPRSAPQRTPVVRPSALEPEERKKKNSLSPAEERDLFDWLTSTRKITSSVRAYVRKVTANGDLDELLAEWREARASRTNTSALPPLCARCREDSPVLPDGLTPAAATNVRFRVGTEGAPCPDCHPDSQRAAGSAS